MIEIPQNDYGAAEDAKIEAATRKVLDDLQRCGNSYLYRTGWPEWCAMEVAKRFTAKGYHARRIEHMRGDGPSWFWYGVEIGKARFSPEALPKSVSTVIG